MPAEEVAIGLRVKLQVRPGTGEEPAIPVFVAEAP
jgi:hypothetical protein